MGKIGGLCHRHGGGGCKSESQSFTTSVCTANQHKRRRRNRNKRQNDSRVSLFKIFLISLLLFVLNGGIISVHASKIQNRQKPCAGKEPCSCDHLEAFNSRMVPRVLKHTVNDVGTSAAILKRSAFNHNQRFLFIGDNIFFVDSIQGYSGYSSVHKVALQGYSELNFISHTQQLRVKNNWAFDMTIRRGLKYQYLTAGMESDVTERMSVQAWSNPIQLSGDIATLAWIDVPYWNTETSLTSNETASYKPTDVYLFDVATQVMSILPESASYIYNGQGSQGTVRFQPSVAGKYIVYHEFDVELERSSVLLYNMVTEVSMPLQFQDGSQDDHSGFAGQIVELGVTDWTLSIQSNDESITTWITWLDTAHKVKLIGSQRQIVIISQQASSDNDAASAGIHQDEVTLEFMDVSSGHRHSLANFNSSSAFSISSLGLTYSYIHNYILTNSFIFVLMCTSSALEFDTECIVRQCSVEDTAAEKTAEFSGSMDVLSTCASFTDIESTRAREAPLSLHQAQDSTLLYWEHISITNSTTDNNAVLHTLTLSPLVSESDARFESTCAIIHSHTTEDIVDAVLQRDNVLWVSGDGMMHITDLDKDNDGVNDVIDAFPMIGELSWDSDNDGVGDEADLIDSSAEACASSEDVGACASDFDKLMIMWITILIVVVTHKIKIHRHYNACYNSILDTLEAAAYAGVTDDSDQPGSYHGGSFSLDNSSGGGSSSAGASLTDSSGGSPISGYEAPKHPHRSRMFAVLRSKIPDSKSTRHLRNVTKIAPGSFDMSSSYRVGGKRTRDGKEKKSETGGRAESNRMRSPLSHTRSQRRRASEHSSLGLSTGTWFNEDPYLKKRYQIYLQETDLNHKIMRDLKALLAGITGEEDVESLKPVVHQKLDALTHIMMHKRFPNVVLVHAVTHVIEQLIALATILTANDLLFYGGTTSSQTIMLSAWLDFTLMPVIWLDLVSKFIARRSVREFLDMNWASLLALWTDVPYFTLPSSAMYEVQAMLRYTKFFRVARIYHIAAHKDSFVTFMVRRPEWFLAAFLALFLMIAALCMRIFEYQFAADTESDFNSISNSLWFSFVTVTTVGYGKYVPITELGRGMAFVLMIVGIGLTGTLSSGVAQAIQTVGSTGNKVKQLKANNKARAEQYFSVLQESTVAYNPVLNVMGPLFEVSVVAPDSGIAGVIWGAMSTAATSSNNKSFESFGKLRPKGNGNGLTKSQTAEIIAMSPSNRRRKRNSSSSISSMISDDGEARQFKLSLEVALKLCADKVWKDGTNSAHASARVAQSKKVAAGLKLEDILLDRSAEYRPRVRLELLLRSFSVHNTAGKKFGELIVRLNKIIFAQPKQHDLFLERAFSISEHAHARAEAVRKAKEKNIKRSRPRLFEDDDDNDDNNDQVYEMQDPIDTKLTAVEVVLRESQFQLYNNVNFHLINGEVALLVLQYDRLLSAKWAFANLELKLERVDTIQKPEMATKVATQAIKTLIEKMPSDFKQQRISEFLNVNFEQDSYKFGTSPTNGRTVSNNTHNLVLSKGAKIRNVAARIIKKNKTGDIKKVPAGGQGFRARPRQSGRRGSFQRSVLQQSHNQTAKVATKQRGSSISVRLSNAGRRASMVLGNGAAAVFASATAGAVEYRSGSSAGGGSSGYSEGGDVKNKIQGGVSSKVTPSGNDSGIVQDEFTSLIDGVDWSDEGSVIKEEPREDVLGRPVKREVSAAVAGERGGGGSGEGEPDLEDLFDDIVKRSSYLQDGSSAQREPR